MGLGTRRFPRLLALEGLFAEALPATFAGRLRMGLGDDALLREALLRPAAERGGVEARCLDGTVARERLGQVYSTLLNILCQCNLRERSA